jgi:hypothetical protein
MNAMERCKGWVINPLGNAEQKADEEEGYSYFQGILQRPGMYPSK